MPVRFQVDPDFYDHPKVTGMSDTAFALWVRAGSYSVAKLTDGLISEDVLAHTLRYEVQVADELVQRGLWRRTKGGWRFHQFESRNLTRKRVEADREADRKRKRSSRDKERSSSDDDNPQGVDNRPEGTESGEQNANMQDNPGIVQPDTTRTRSGTQADSKRNPALSVSVSVSESSRGSFSGKGPVGSPRDQRPPERCPKHTNDDRPPNCGACADARRTAERFDADWRAVVRACPFCDPEGWRYEFGRRHVVSPYVRCDHTPPEQP